jgi:hypothetical protein
VLAKDHWMRDQLKASAANGDVPQDARLELIEALNGWTRWALTTPRLSRRGSGCARWPQGLGGDQASPRRIDRGDGQADARAMTTKRTTAKKRKRTKKPASFSDVLTTAAPGKKRLARPKEKSAMRRSRLCAALTFYGLLASASSAAAECAWVLWTEVALHAADQTPVWTPQHRFANVAACQEIFLTKIENHKKDKDRYTVVQDTIMDNRSLYFTRYTCLPDTVDPRGLKGR